jgi:hypothetical protein
MKSSTARPSLRNSGFETTRRQRPRAAFLQLLGDRARTLSAVPTGTVDLSTMTRARPCAADAARGGEHVLQVGRAVLAGRRADRDESAASPCATAAAGVGGEAQPPAATLRARSSFRPGS